LSFREPSPGSRATGVASALGAFFLWGILPVYWKALHDVPAIEVIAHRTVWSLGFLLLVLRWRGSLGQFREALRSPRFVALYFTSGALLAVNWLTYIWAVLSGQIVEASLGYFLVPLCNVALGMLVLRERLRPSQWLAVAFAAAGVLNELGQLGRLPWVALVLAVSFALYGLLRKRGPLGPLTGLAVETTMLAPLAIGFILWRQFAGVGALGGVSATEHALLLSAGVVTAVPLLLFAAGARLLPLTSLGLLQYLSPTVQLLLGVFAYGESFGRARMASFTLIWAALLLYSIDGILAGRRRGTPATSTTAAS
jgi:chloramphenicol-sensitive protein RarD